MAAIYAMCPTCGNPRVGDAIYRCPECGRICCINCIQETWSSWGHCPGCNFKLDSSSYRIGEIGRF